MKRTLSTLLGAAALAAAFLPSAAEAQTGYQYYAVTPCRVVDTRIVNPDQPAPRNAAITPLPALFPVPPGQPGDQPGWTTPTDPETPQNFKIREANQASSATPCGVPNTAVAVSLNLTATQIGSQGNIRIWPFGGLMPRVSTINLTTADPSLANGAIVPFPAFSAGQPDISLRFTTANKTGPVHVILDVTGYFAP